MSCVKPLRHKEAAPGVCNYSTSAGLLFTKLLWAEKQLYKMSLAWERDAATKEIQQQTQLRHIFYFRLPKLALRSSHLPGEVILQFILPYILSMLYISYFSEWDLLLYLSALVLLLVPWKLIIYLHNKNMVRIKKKCIIHWSERRDYHVLKDIDIAGFDI